MRLLLILLLGLGAARASADDAAPASAETVKDVDKFLKTPVAELPPDSIEGFLKIDAATLPKRLQEPYQARRLELYTLKQMMESKKKGMIRMMDKSCDVPEETQGFSAGAYKMAGYQEITPDDVSCSIERTHCSEKELMCEFSLREVVETDKKGKKRYHFFLHPNDPLMAIVTACRNNSGGQTNFFGTMQAECTH